MYRLDATKRCELFEIIADDIWDSIVDNHREGVHKNEIGITNDIVTIIRRHHRLHPNFGVWSNPGVDEDTNGGDIDIFVETDLNQFLWYALQAKVLKIGDKYERLIKKRQWEKLANLQAVAGCIPFYLFYNGIDKKLSSTRDCCDKEVTEKQFGCMIAEIDIVERIASQRSEPRYIDFYPRNGHPWRELVCCMAKRRKGTILTLGQVQNALSYYEGVINSTIIYRGSNNEHLDSQVNTIRINNNTVGRNPTHSFAIRTTAGLNQLSSR
jgi:hypothetical protein